MVRTTTNRAKRWRDQNTALHWCAAGFIEAGKSFLKIDGAKDMRVLETALGRKLNEPAKKAAQDESHRRRFQLRAGRRPPRWLGPMRRGRSRGATDIALSTFV